MSPSPFPLNIAFLIVLIAATAYFASNIRRLYLHLRIGRHEDRLDHPGARARDFIAYVVAQVRLFKAPYTLSGLAHALTFWGFVVLSVGTLVTFAKGVFPGLVVPGVDGDPLYYFLQDLFVGLVIIAILGFFVRRLFVRPKRLELGSDGLIILGLILVLMLTDLTTSGFRDAYLGRSEPGAFLGAFVVGLFHGMDRGVVRWAYSLSWWIHSLVLLGFLNYLPFSKHLHMLVAPFNVFFRPSASKGQLSKMVLDLENAESFGVNKLEELTWKDLLDTYACTHCGRCDDNCPANLNNQPLSPRNLILDLRHYFDERFPLRGDTPEDGVKALAGEVFPKESIWSCTTCRACMHFCPVFVEHLPKIVDVRRYLVLTESDFPNELAPVFTNIERNGNPWEIGASSRADWAKGLGVKTLAEDPEAEYLLWVGCFGSFDERNQRVVVSLATLLQQAGVRFAILGREEKCCGDPARRAGNEYLFQTIVEENVAILNGYNVRKIVTACPHCFNTLKHEYPQFDGSYEVIHHSVLLADLIAQGKIRPSRDIPRTIAMHDPCYLGRYNDLYEEPRKVLCSIPGVKLVEMERSRGRAMCCGGGGARAFMEDRHGSKINEARVEQAIAVGPDVIATACPYCMTMLEDGVKTRGVEGRVQPLDIAELLAGSVSIGPGADRVFPVDQLT